MEKNFVVIARTQAGPSVSLVRARHSAGARKIASQYLPPGTEIKAFNSGLTCQLDSIGIILAHWLENPVVEVAQ